MCRGWMIGSRQYRTEMNKKLSKMDRAKSWGRAELRELNETEWANLLGQCLQISGKNPAAINESLKSAPWKVIIATWMKTRTSVSNGWLGENLNMGAASAVSRNVAAMQKKQPKRYRQYRRLTENISK